MTDNEQQGQEIIPPTTQIDQEILSSLGLTHEYVEKYDKERQEDQKFLEAMRKRGSKEYMQAKPGRIGTVRIDLGAVVLPVETPQKDNIYPPLAPNTRSSNHCLEKISNRTPISL